MKIFLSTKAAKQLRKLPSRMYALLIAEIKSLNKNPFPTKSKKLVSREGWRLRVGMYRILYTVDKKKNEVIVLSIAHRKDAYRL